jgi:antitoxin HicB
VGKGFALVLIFFLYVPQGGAWVLGVRPLAPPGVVGREKKTVTKAQKRGIVDDSLKQKGGFEATRAVAIKRVLARQIEQAMKEGHITKADMARRMRTSRSQLNRLLDPEHDSATLTTLHRAARVIGRRIRMQLV